MGWTYKREEKSAYTTRIPEGKIRIRIKSAEKAQSKSGNDMLVLQFDISGYTETIYHYIVFLDDRPEITNRMLTQFFDSFKDIEDGNFDMKSWIGKVGAAAIKHEEYNGNVNAKISWFVPADKQGDIAPWKEPQTGGGSVSPNAAPIPDTGGAFAPMPSGVEIPFI